MRNTLFFLILLTFRINTIFGQFQSKLDYQTEEVSFESQGATLSGTIYQPSKAHAALVIVHGSGQTERMTRFAQLLAQEGIASLTYDKRGVGKSEGIYAGPEVGTNNIDSTNLKLLASDASAAVHKLQQYIKHTPVGLMGFSQAGWIMPLAATYNEEVDFMVLFSCPTITSLEQLRFQFHTDGRKDYWEHHTEAEARGHLYNDPDRYQFTGIDPKVALSDLAIPALWIFGEKDIQIPTKVCIEQLNDLKAVGKPYEYILFPSLGHNTAAAGTTAPVDIALQWIAQNTGQSVHNKTTK